MKQKTKRILHKQENPHFLEKFHPCSRDLTMNCRWIYRCFINYKSEMRAKFTQYINNIIWIWEIESWYFFVVIAWLTIILWLLIFLKIKADKWILNSKKNITYNIDQIIYELAKFQKSNPISQSNTKTMDILFDVENPNYLKNFNLIESEIKNIWNEYWEDFIDQTLLKKVKKSFNILKLKNILQKIIIISSVILFCLIVTIIVLATK